MKKITGYFPKRGSDTNRLTENPSAVTASLLTATEKTATAHESTCFATTKCKNRLQRASPQDSSPWHHDNLYNRQSTYMKKPYTHFIYIKFTPDTLCIYNPRR